MDWCIYVGSAATENFTLGLKQKIWGHKKIFKDNQLRDIQSGDRLFFVHHLQQLRQARDPNQSGFPRVSIENLYGVVNSITECRVTSDYYYDETPLWPDDTYPHRFKFDVINQKTTLHFGLEIFCKEFVSAVRESLLRKGLPYPFSAELGNDIYSSFDLMDVEVSEGAPVYSTHMKRERNREIIELKKQATLRAGGKLQCEVCGFDFGVAYGDRGKDFIECHHLNPLADTELNQTTKLEDLAFVCSNCHSIIHRHKPWLELKQLSEIITMKTTPT